MTVDIGVAPRSAAFGFVLLSEGFGLAWFRLDFFGLDVFSIEPGTLSMLCKC